MDTLSNEELAHDAVHMRELAASQMWDIYRKYLDQMIREWSRNLRTDGEEFHNHHVGVLEGLEMVRNLPDNIVSWSKYSHKESA